PPRGWRRLAPRGLLTPPTPLDGWAAAVLAFDHLKKPDQK
ncbi:MAG: resolvase, partial [Chloroflexota bacterium]